MSKKRRKDDTEEEKHQRKDLLSEEIVSHGSNPEIRIISQINR